MVGVRLAVPHGLIHFSVWQVGRVSVWDGRRNHFHFWLFFTGQNLSWRCDQSANLQKIRSASRRAMCLVVNARDKSFETSQPSILKVCIPKQPAQASKLGTIITLGIPTEVRSIIRTNDIFWWTHFLTKTEMGHHSAHFESKIGQFN